MSPAYTPPAVMDDFTADRKKSHDFWLGPIVRTHKVGCEYQFIEYLVKNAGNRPDPGAVTEEVGFACYINKRRIGISTESFDAALATVIAHKHDGGNSRAAIYFLRMIGADSRASE